MNHCINPTYLLEIWGEQLVVFQILILFWNSNWESICPISDGTISHILGPSYDKISSVLKHDFHYWQTNVRRISQNIIIHFTTAKRFIYHEPFPQHLQQSLSKQANYLKRMNKELGYWIFSYNRFHNVLRLFDVMPNFPFITSETMRDYYL